MVCRSFGEGGEFCIKTPPGHIPEKLVYDEICFPMSRMHNSSDKTLKNTQLNTIIRKYSYLIIYIAPCKGVGSNITH